MKKFLILVAFYCCYVFIFYQRPPVNVVVEIKKGQSLWQIDKEFSKHYLTPHPGFLMIYSVLTGGHRKIKVGEYRIHDLSLHITLRKLIRGECILYKIIFPEGMSVKEIVNALNGAPYLEERITTYPPEGTLFPATYYYPKGCPRSRIIHQMQTQMVTILKDLWTRKQVLRSPQEALILASIVEKETHFAHERTMVASVYLKRLKIGMRLQADPCVAYGLGKKELRKGDISKETPYNTYKHKGLPPTPICCPGRASLEAVFAADENTPHLYFVLGKSGHTFSGDFKAHKENVKVYRKIQKAS